MREKKIEVEQYYGSNITYYTARCFPLRSESDCFLIITRHIRHLTLDNAATPVTAAGAAPARMRECRRRGRFKAGVSCPTEQVHIRTANLDTLSLHT